MTTLRAFDLAAAEPWAITEAGLRQVLAIAARERLDVQLAEEIRAERRERLEVLERRGGAELEGSNNVTVRDGVAVVPIVGTIMRRGNMMARISGAQSIEMLSRDIELARRSPEVRAILLAIDSQGGQVNGTHELGEQIFELRAAGMPVEAYVSGTGASAAYWLASAASRITIDATAHLGSIGVVATVTDSREADRRAGVETIEIVSSNAEFKRADIATDEGRAVILAQLDALEAVFVDRVARNRARSVDTVLSEFGRGRVFTGAEVVRRGMADALGSFETVLGRLAAGKRGGRLRAVAQSTGRQLGMTDIQPTATEAEADAPIGADTDAATTAGEPIVGTLELVAYGSAADLAAAYPEFVGELEGAAATAERDRVLEVFGACRNEADRAIVDRLVRDGKSRGVDAKAALYDADRSAGGRMIQSLAGETPQPAAPAAAPSASAAPNDPHAIKAGADQIIASEKAAGRTVSRAEATMRFVNSARG